MSQPLRFIHASDFHLDQPLYGLDGFPERIRDRLVDAPFTAARQVFETAVLEEVDFVLLAGDLVDPQSSDARGISFLFDQFHQLLEHNIAVYWIGGQTDRPNRWPDTFKMPEGVHFFSQTRVEEVTHFRGDEPLLTINGRSHDGRMRFRNSDFHPDSATPFNIALAYGLAEAEILSAQEFDYWALGSEHNRHTLYSSPRTAHYSGSPQGRCPAEDGIHGCTLVQVGEDGQIRTRLVATEDVRFVTESVTLNHKTTMSELQRILMDRLSGLESNAGEMPQLVTIFVENADTMFPHQTRLRLTDNVLEELRKPRSHNQSIVWAAAIQFDQPASVASELYKEDTILGDFLREVRQYETDAEKELEIDEYLPRHIENLPAVSLENLTDEQRAEVLREVTALGTEMLRGDAA